MFYNTIREDSPLREVWENIFYNTIYFGMGIIVNWSYKPLAIQYRLTNRKFI